MLRAPVNSNTLSPGSLWQHMLSFPFVKEFVIQRIAFAIDDAFPMDEDSANGDRKKFVDGIKTAFYQMAGYHLRLEQQAFCPVLKSFRFFKSLPLELQTKIWNYYSCLPYPLLLVCNKKFQILNGKFYEVTSRNFTEFMTLNKTDVARITDLKATWVTTQVDLPLNYDR
jgi:hypothetical protein